MGDEPEYMELAVHFMSNNSWSSICLLPSPRSVLQNDGTAVPFTAPSLATPKGLSTNARISSFHTLASLLNPIPGTHPGTCLKNGNTSTGHMPPEEAMRLESSETQCSAMARKGSAADVMRRP